MSCRVARCLNWAMLSRADARCHTSPWQGDDARKHTRIPRKAAVSLHSPAKRAADFGQKWPQCSPALVPWLGWEEGEETTMTRTATNHAPRCCLLIDDDSAKVTWRCRPQPAYRYMHTPNDWGFALCTFGWCCVSVFLDKPTRVTELHDFTPGYGLCVPLFGTTNVQVGVLFWWLRPVIYSAKRTVAFATRFVMLVD